MKGFESTQQEEIFREKEVNVQRQRNMKEQKRGGKRLGFLLCNSNSIWL